jgi:hypothetical protein
MPAHCHVLRGFGARFGRSLPMRQKKWPTIFKKQSSFDEKRSTFFQKLGVFWAPYPAFAYEMRAKLIISQLKQVESETMAKIIAQKNK